MKEYTYLSLNEFFDTKEEKQNKVRAQCDHYLCHHAFKVDEAIIEEIEGIFPDFSFTTTCTEQMRYEFDEYLHSIFQDKIIYSGAYGIDGYWRIMKPRVTS